MYEEFVQFDRGYRLYLHGKNIPNIKVAHVREVEEIRMIKGWKKVHPAFITNWLLRKPVADKFLRIGGGELSSSDDGLQLFGGWDTDFKSNWISWGQFFFEGGTFFFS